MLFFFNPKIKTAIDDFYGNTCTDHDSDKTIKYVCPADGCKIEELLIIKTRRFISEINCQLKYRSCPDFKICSRKCYTDICAGNNPQSTGPNIFQYRQILIEIVNIGYEYNYVNLCALIQEEINCLNTIILSFGRNCCSIELTLAISDINCRSGCPNYDWLINSICQCLKNIERCDLFSSNYWNCLIDQLCGSPIPREKIADLIESIIIKKINVIKCIAESKEAFTAPKEIVLYSAYLNVFLIENLSKCFIYKKLFILNAQVPKFANCCSGDKLACCVTEKSYEEALCLERKLLILCCPKEKCDPIDPNNVDVEESYNEQKYQN